MTIEIFKFSNPEETVLTLEQGKSFHGYLPNGDEIQLIAEGPRQGGRLIIKRNEIEVARRLLKVGHAQQLADQMAARGA